MARLELSRFVEDGLDEIAGYIAEDNPLGAVTFLQEIRAKFAGIRRDPLIYRLRPDICAHARMPAVGNHAIVFRVVGRAVRIERVIYAGRDLAIAFDPAD